MKQLKLLVMLALCSSPIVALKKNESVSPEQMIMLMDKALAEKKFKLAAQWRARFTIVVGLAAVCSNDPSDAAAMDMLTIREWSGMLQEMAQNVSPQEYRDIFVEQLAEVEQEFLDNKLTDPKWIAAYGMSAFLGESASGKHFVSAIECYNKRKEFIEEFKKAVKNQPAENKN